MAFGITKHELAKWKQAIDNDELAFITHYWIDDRFPDMTTVTKVGCKDMEKLARWGSKYGLKAKWIHHRQDGYSHFDLLGEKQVEILKEEGLLEQLETFQKSITNR